MNITDLPLELLCVILSYINESKTISALFLTLNKTIINGLACAIKEVTGDFKKMLRGLTNVERLFLGGTIDVLDDLYQLAKLPKLNKLSVRIKPVHSKEFIEIIKVFIVRCEHLDQKEIEIYAGWIVFRSMNGVLKIYNKTLYPIEVEEIIDFLQFSRQYQPLTTFHECFLRLWDQYDNLSTLQTLVGYLESVEEFDTICIDNSPTYRFHQLFSPGKIKHLRSEVTNNDYISYLTPNPYILTFDVPLYLNQVPTLLSKYSNIQHIKLYSETGFFSGHLITPSDLAPLISLPHLRSITLITSQPSLYSFLPKIMIEYQSPPLRFTLPAS